MGSLPLMLSLAKENVRQKGRIGPKLDGNFPRATDSSQGANMSQTMLSLGTCLEFWEQGVGGAPLNGFQEATTNQIILDMRLKEISS